AFPSGSGMRQSANVQGDAVWLGLGSEADFKDRDVSGKVAIIYSMFVPGGRSHSASNRSKLFYANKRASQQGASLIVNIMGVPGNAQFMPAPHYLTRGKVIKPLKVPVVTISQDDGFAIRDDIAANDVQVAYQSEWVKQKNVEANYLIAELKGKSSEEVIIAAHTDGYFEGALDNASGVAVTLEMAHHYATQKELPDRTIKLFFFPDHHHGEFTRREFEEAHNWDNVALVITVEHPSQTQLYWYNDGLMTSNAIGAFRWNVSGSEKLKSTILDSFKQNGISTYTVMDPNPKFTKQAPSFHIIDHVIYHTTLDIPELVPVEGMKRATKSFLNIVDKANEMTLAELRPVKSSTTSNQGK
ncbi:MAG: M28 family peptidase, partial [Enterobacterales bacterium]|nr:M28 family peptidase [Enterobacterales bacterium]